MANFKLTYGNMFNPPEEMHKGFDKAVAKLKANLGREYGMIIDGKDVFAVNKYEDHSPVNTDWVLAVMQKGDASHANMAIDAARKAFPPGAERPGRNASNWCARQLQILRSAFSNSVQPWHSRSARTVWSRWATCRRQPTSCIGPPRWWKRITVSSNRWAMIR